MISIKELLIKVFLMSSKVGNAEIIQRTVRRWISRVGKLDKVKYNKSVICFNDINVFNSKKRSKNDTHNKKRENIF